MCACLCVFSNQVLGRETFWSFCRLKYSADTTVDKGNIIHAHAGPQLTRVPDTLPRFIRSIRYGARS